MDYEIFSDTDENRRYYVTLVNRYIKAGQLEELRELRLFYLQNRNKINVEDQDGTACE